MPGGFTFDPAGVQRAAQALDDAATTLAGHEGDTAARPDAGRSTGELSAALGQLAAMTQTAVAALHTAADGLRDSAETYARADAGAQSLLHGLAP